VSRVLIIRYAVELARDEIQLRLARHEIHQDGLSSSSLIVAGGGLGRNRKSMQIGLNPGRSSVNPGRSSVLVNFDAYFSGVGLQGSGCICGGGALLEPGTTGRGPVPSGEVYGS
jgi:hypothetical protein